MTATKPPFWQPYWEHNNAMAARRIDPPAPIAPQAVIAKHGDADATPMEGSTT